MCFEPLPINHRLHNGHGLVDAGQVLAIQGIQAHLRGEGLGAALAAKEDDPFVKDGQAADLHRPGGAHKGVGGDPIEVADIYGVEAPVEADGLHVGGHVQQLGLGGLDAAGTIKGALRALSEVDAKILNAVFITTGVHDLPGVYADGLADAGGIANGAGHDLFRHCWLPPE